MDEIQSAYIPWHEGSHLITKNPGESPAFRRVIGLMAEYFDIDLTKPHATRFNWYKSLNDWKPMHHDSAGFNRERAKSQNITIGVTFGAKRELTFLHAKNHTTVNFPQENNMMFSFGSSVNIRFMHGIVALTEQQKKEFESGRISIILWGWSNLVDRQPGDPDMIPERKTDRNRHRDFNRIQR